MRNRIQFFSLFILAASIAGMVLSAFLIFEYFGVTASVTDAVCARGREGVNACMVVSASRYAGIRGVPLVGDIPVAVMGYVFYGFIAALIIIHGFRRDTESLSMGIIIISVLTGAACIANITLYGISAYIIRFMCPLCLMTYAATVVIFVPSLLILKTTITSVRGSIAMNMLRHIRKYGVYMVLIAIVLGAVGMGIGAGARLVANEAKMVSLQDRLKKAIRQYENAREIDIDTKGVPLIGKPGSPARFSVFFDFTCDHCRDEILLLEQMVREYPDAVSVYFKYLPLNGDCANLDRGRDNPSADACIAAAASYCAYKQDRFMDYAKSLFELYHVKGNPFNVKSVRHLAKSKRFDMAAFDRCFDSPETGNVITRQYREAERLGVASTPTLYLNGKLLTAGSRKPEIMKGLIRYCIQKNKSK